MKLSLCVSVDMFGDVGWQLAAYDDGPDDCAKFDMDIAERRHVDPFEGLASDGADEIANVTWSFAVVGEAEVAQVESALMGCSEPSR